MLNESGEVCCDRCGQVLQIGDHPFCPHGRGAAAMNRDEIPGGVTVENYGRHPMTFYSHSERRRYMAEHGLREREKFSPLPGTDKDPQGIPNPKGYMDPYTLEAGRILISRNGAKQEPEVKPEGVLVDFTSGHLTTRDAEAIASGDPHRQSRLHRRQHGK